MSCRNLLEDVETTLAEFLADLRDNIFTSDTERGDLLLVEFFFKKLPQLAKMSYIVDHLLPYKRMIDEEKAEFFIKKKDKIFAGLPPERVNYFAHLVQTPASQGRMSNENRGYVWAYLKTLVAAADEYKKRV